MIKHTIDCHYNNQLYWCDGNNSREDKFPKTTFDTSDIHSNIYKDFILCSKMEELLFSKITDLTFYIVKLLEF